MFMSSNMERYESLTRECVARMQHRILWCLWPFFTHHIIRIYSIYRVRLEGVETSGTNNSNRLIVPTRCLKKQVVQVLPTTHGSKIRRYLEYSLFEEVPNAQPNDPQRCRLNLYFRQAGESRCLGYSIRNLRGKSSSHLSCYCNMFFGKKTHRFQEAYCSSLRVVVTNAQIFSM